MPILGVCLGHQAIGQAFGGKIVHAKQAHARQDLAIRHHGRRRFRDLPNPLQATRYHSLVDRAANRCRTVSKSPRGPTTARSWACGTARCAVEGVQFHPESILTEHGHAC